MPGRILPLAVGEIYHVINRGISGQQVFVGERCLERAWQTLLYYRYQAVPISASELLDLPAEARVSILNKLAEENKLMTEMIAGCLMPDHFHFLLRQVQEGGISTFVGNFCNSYTRYFNLSHKRLGPLFLGKFKAVRVETEEQLWHVSRYIHLNPLTSGVVRDWEGLEHYSYSSLPEYLKQETAFFSKETVLNNFKSSGSYKAFVSDRAEYQRRLEGIKHLNLE